MPEHRQKDKFMIPIDIWYLLLLFIAGIAAGFLNVVAGGGSLLTLPLMITTGIPAVMANGTNRVAILLQNFTAMVNFSRAGFSDFRQSLLLALCTLPGAFLGAWLGVKIEGVWFNRILTLIMGVILVMNLLKNRQKPHTLDDETSSSDKKKPHKVMGYLLMVGVGFYGGFIQAGVGFLLMAVLERVLGFDLVTVNMHKIFIVASYTLVSLLVFALKDQVLWKAGLCLAMGNAIGGWLGASFSIKKGEKYIRIILNILIAFFIVKLLLVSI